MAQEAAGAELALVSRWLVDTGPLVAYLDAHDPAHAKVAGCLGGFTGSLVTTSAVVTETMHFVAPDRSGPRRLAELVETTGLEVFDLSRPPELYEAVGLMERYADTPMDFADATLVLLAEALEVHDILTLDLRGFATYRTRDNRALQLVMVV